METIKVVTLTQLELENLVHNAAYKAIELYRKNNSPDLPEWITNKQATKLLNKKSRITVDNMVKRGLIEKKYEGNKPLYKKTDVLRWID